MNYDGSSDCESSGATVSLLTLSASPATIPTLSGTRLRARAKHTSSSRPAALRSAIAG